MNSISSSQIIFGIAGIFLAWSIAVALVRGEWRSRGHRYGRRDQPVDYWFNLLFSIAGLAMVAWLVLDSQDLQGSRAWQVAPAFFLGIPAAFWLVRALRTGSFGPGGVHRAEKPGQFWLLSLGLLAVLAFAGWILTWPKAPERATFYDQVGPVLASVRAQLPDRGPGEFYNVRVDSKTRFICGAVRRPDGKMLRFFGNGSRVQSDATVESDGLPTFAASYSRLCGGEPILP
jgi:hypothetical protein